ncbi:cell division protein PerM [Corynebacterium bouchesdurhonense]|uniref:cell division protein PerM n=1 Tax=Corynebacterium bouchesdurhonense TaxID=1720192 RepID=UPI000A747254|nr:DUF6350 family protein [Corynebacterium bouchesdurhonense]
MSTKFSPRSAPQRRPAQPQRRRAIRGRAPGAKREKPTPAAPTTWRQRLRTYAPHASAPLVVLALTIVAVCLAVLLAGGWSMTYLPAAIGQTWLSVHAAPLVVGGVELAAAPLLPAVGVVALVAVRVRAATRDRVSVLDLAAILGLLTATSLVLSGIALFMVSDASNVYNIAAPNPAAALLLPLGLHLIGFVFGVRPVIWRALASRAGVPQLAVDACGHAASFLRGLLIAAAAAYLVALAAGYQRVGELIGAFPNLGWGGGIALALLCAAYLPNAVVATLAVLLGGSFEYGPGALSLFSATAAPMPPLPLFAAVPPAMPSWAPVLMLVPAAIAVRFAATRGFSLVDATATAAWSALLGALAAAYASGRAGAYEFVGTRPGILALALFAWTFVTCLCAWLVALVRGRAARAGEDAKEDASQDTNDDAGEEAGEGTSEDISEDGEGIKGE